MKEFLRRLRFYAIGFGIGLLFVFFFFENRGCSWLPSNRVKNEFLNRTLVVSTEQMKAMQSAGITESMILEFLNEGDVSFGKSKKHGNPQVYELSHEVNGTEKRLWFVLARNAWIAEVILPHGSIHAAGHTKSGIGKLVHFPRVANYLFLDDNKRLKCQKDQLQIPSEKKLQYLLKKNSWIDFSRSTLLASEPGQFISFISPANDTISAESRWYQDHVQITEFITSDSIRCK